MYGEKNIVNIIDQTRGNEYVGPNLVSIKQIVVTPEGSDTLLTIYFSEAISGSIDMIARMAAYFNSSIQLAADKLSMTYKIVLPPGPSLLDIYKEDKDLALQMLGNMVDNLCDKIVDNLGGHNVIELYKDIKMTNVLTDHDRSCLVRSEPYKPNSLVNFITDRRQRHAELRKYGKVFALIAKIMPGSKKRAKYEQEEDGRSDAGRTAKRARRSWNPKSLSAEIFMETWMKFFGF